MGVATLLILLCHAAPNGVTLPLFFDKLFGLGNIGVDVFFFLSGVGLFFSIKKRKISFFRWYIRRYKRILIPYFIIAIPWYGSRVFFTDDTIVNFVLNLTTVSFWLEHKGAWFVAALVPLYLVSPFFYKLVNNGQGIIFLFLVILICTFCDKIIPSYGVFLNVNFVLHRLPCFFIGLFSGSYILNKKKINFFSFLISVLCLIILLKCMHSVNLISEGYIWPSIFILIPFCCCIFNNFKKVGVFFVLLGKISLESYLMNICLGNLLKTCNYLGHSSFTYLFLILILGTIIAYFVNRLVANLYKL